MEDMGRSVKLGLAALQRHYPERSLRETTGDGSSLGADLEASSRKR